MREIKFRAWDKKNRKWENFAHITLDGQYWQPVKTVDYEDIILMQYTGLKDKNGKEIYEGDIYKLKDDRTFTVLESLQQFFESKELGENEFGDDFSTLEILGNIYENPDLLNIKK